MDLNADLGEQGVGGFENDALILKYVTSANIACGGHAGTLQTMMLCLGEAKRLNVTVGAHLSYPDLANFGRVTMSISDNALHASLTAQLQELIFAAREQNVVVRYVKPHGALYHDSKNLGVANILCDVMANSMGMVDGSGVSIPLALLVAPGNPVDRVASRFQIPVYREGFLDRGYQPDGTLMPRNLEGAVITDSATILRRASAFAEQQPVAAHSGELLHMNVDSVCVHSDTPKAAVFAKLAHTSITKSVGSPRSFLPELFS